MRYPRETFEYMEIDFSNIKVIQKIQDLNQEKYYF